MTDTIKPEIYRALTQPQRRALRNRYVEAQNGLCMHCEAPLNGDAPSEIKAKKINWRRFPEGFLKYPVHLQHCHRSGMTEGAVHAYCNAVLWQYHER